MQCFIPPNTQGATKLLIFFLDTYSLATVALVLFP